MSLPRKKRTAPTTQGVRLGGRSKRVVDAVLKAAVQELARSGYVAFQIEEVARASEVNRTSIYRRWPTKAQLVEAALHSLPPFARTRPATGDLARDLVEMMRQFTGWMLTSQGRSLRKMVMQDLREPELMRIVDGLRTHSLLPWAAVIAEGKTRGELRRSVDPHLFTQMLLAPLMARMDALEPVNLKVYKAIVEIALAGARPRPR